MSFSETIFLFFLALVIFGPKKLPEIARQAGKLLAELRRASNEFRSQIETEIAHLEVEKKYPSLPSSDPPAGAVANSVAGSGASLSLNPAASEVVPHESTATLAASPATPAEPSPPIESSALESSTASESIPSSTEPVTDTATVPASQDSHV
jgi:sec-independent protein translocase protein TatB